MRPLIVNRFNCFLFPLALFWTCLITSQPVFGRVQQSSEPSRSPATVQADDRSLQLEPSGLLTNADSTPESILPADAMVHFRVNGLAGLLNDASEMATPFIPEKAIGPAAEMALEQPHPLLALIGLQTMGEPLSVDMLVGMSGVDPARPVSVSLYLAPPPQGYIICLPVLDLERPSALLQNLLPPNSPVAKLELDGGFAQHVATPDFDIFIVCSTDTVCLCGSRQLAQAVLHAADQPRLDQSKLIADAVKRHASDNLLLAADANPAKPLLAMIESYRTLPPEQIAQARSIFLAGFDPSALSSLDQRLRSQFGIRDSEQALDYVECLVTGSYEVLFETLMEAASELQGLTMAVDLTLEFQSIRFSVLSDTIKQADSIQPVPMEDVQNVIASLPGSHDFLVFTGRKPSPRKWVWPANMIARVGEKMQAKDLPMQTHALIRNAYNDHMQVEPLESQVDWTIGTGFMVSSKSPSDYENLNSFLSEWFAQIALINLQAIPLQDEGILEAHFEQKAKTMNANHANWRKLWRDINGRESWLSQSSSSRNDEPQNGIHRLVYEDRLKTAGGLFGYNEHELISRYFTLYRNGDDHTLLWPGGHDLELFAGLRAGPVAPAINRLIENSHLSDDVQQVEIGRNIHSVVDVVDLLASFESLVHRDLADYLDQLQEIADDRREGETEESRFSELASIEMPWTVAHVQARSDTGELYLVTPVGWTFPRHKIIPAAAELLDDYRQVADSVGGAIFHHTTHDGQNDLVIVQSTAGMSQLIRSVGNNFADEYLNHPQGQQRLRQLFRTDLDGSVFEDVRILSSDMWSFLR